MSHPRMSIPGATYLVTRTTAMSLFLLTPSATVNEIMEYCLAWAARGRGIVLHAVSVESNHFHLVLTDTDGRLSEFMQELNRSAARCLLAHYRQRFPNRRIDAVWTSAQSFSAALLLTPNAILDALVYTFTNPVKDGLVRDYREWPGFNTRPGYWRYADHTASRPSLYFKNTPEQLSYKLTPPAQLGDALEQVIGTVELQIREQQAQAATNLAAQRRSVAGAKAVRATDPLDAPTTPRTVGNLNPHLAAGGDSHVLATAKQALKHFRLAYRAAWQTFKRGAQAVFPGGTWLMSRRFGQPCDPLDAYWCARA